MPSYISKTPNWITAAFILSVIITYVGCPENLQPEGKPTPQHVWYYGWITAVSTGFGVVPLIFTPTLNKYYIGVSNAIAAGMMIAASYSLIMEGLFFDEPDDSWEIVSPAIRTVVGVICGLVFIKLSKTFLDNNDDLTLGNLDIDRADAKKIMLIMLVMTVHSFSEGVGIGVSFGGQNGADLGMFISASLAVHNVPEGFAVAIVWLPRKVSKLTAAMMCILTSLPQPLMAVPAYMFVRYFIPILPVGLGFAGGAMAWVAFMELMIEAYEDTDAVTTGVVSVISLSFMLTLQNALKGE